MSITFDNKEHQLLLEVVEKQKRIINAQQNEIQWFHDIVYKPGFNEVDIRLAVELTPREMRMGYFVETKEKPVYLPDLAEKVHASPKTIVKRTKRMAKAGAVTYRVAKNDDGNNRSYLQVLPVLERPSEIQLDKAERGGGSTWEDGKRVKRCHSCGSADLHLIKKSYIICKNCSEEQPDSRKESMTPVNPPENFDPEPYGHGDSRDFEQEQEGPTEPEPEPEPEPENEACGHGDMRDAASDTEGQKASGHGDYRTSDLDSTPDIKASGHGDSRDSAQSEIPKLPHYTESTVGVSEELPNVPEELLKRRQWVVWRYEWVDGKLKKVPYQAKGKVFKADTTNPAHWTSHEQAYALYRESHEQRWSKPLDGIGFVLANGEVGVDIDKCIVDGKLSDLAADVINTVASYSELSPSETGVHILALGTWPGEWKRRDNLGLEVYSEGRYFTFTGKHIAGTPGDIEERTTPLAAVHAKYAPSEAIARPTEPPCGHTSSTLALVSTDEILLRARSAANGAKFTRLYDDGDITGYTSPSNADLALCNLLAYWTDDADVIDALFRKSALYREEKWDRAARIGETYGEGTIRKALEARNAAWGWHDQAGRDASQPGKEVVCGYA